MRRDGLSSVCSSSGGCRESGFNVRATSPPLDVSAGGYFECHSDTASASQTTYIVLWRSHMSAQFPRPPSLEASFTLLLVQFAIGNVPSSQFSCSKRSPLFSILFFCLCSCLSIYSFCFIFLMSSHALNNLSLQHPEHAC